MRRTRLPPSLGFVDRDETADYHQHSNSFPQNHLDVFHFQGSDCHDVATKDITPEMNPIEQIWKQLRSMGFRNEVFKTLNHVIDRLCETIRRLSSDTVKSITARHWIVDCFLEQE